ncbi:hypothetical protein SLS61_004169 [Didymella pomorum]
MPLPPRIDVHSHFLPPFYRTALSTNGHSNPDGMPAIPSWSKDAHIEMMSTANVTKSILSISSPGVHITSNASLTRSLTRECNAYAAKLKTDDPESGGEGDGKGEEKVDATPLGNQYPVPIFEFLFDTARAVVNLFCTGTIEACPNVTFIIPHAGGALPPLLTRFIQFSSVVPGGRKLDAAKVRAQLDSQFYFDLAGFVFDGDQGGQGQLKALVEGFDIGHERLMYGSDFPFTQTQFVEMFAERMKSGLECLFDEEQRAMVYEGNAKKLLERGRKRKDASL